MRVQGQAAAWLRAMEARAGLRVLRLGQPAYLRELETALRTGTPVLLEDVGETLDPALEPLLLKQACPLLHPGTQPTCGPHLLTCSVRSKSLHVPQASSSSSAANLS